VHKNQCFSGVSVHGGCKPKIKSQKRQQSVCEQITCDH